MYDFNLDWLKRSNKSVRLL